MCVLSVVGTYWEMISVDLKNKMKKEKANVEDRKKISKDERVDDSFEATCPTAYQIFFFYRLDIYGQVSS